MTNTKDYRVYIDTTDNKNRFIILKERTNIIEKANIYTDVVSTIKEILSKHKLTISDISEFIPNTGPGSFTGIKVAITVANILNYILNENSTIYTPNYEKEPNINTK